jgi:hypothetical protein
LEHVFGEASGYVSPEPPDVRAVARSIHPGIEIIETSYTAGDGLDTWRQSIADRMREAAGSRP